VELVENFGFLKVELISFFLKIKELVSGFWF